MIAFELKDPRLAFVSVTRVEVTSDLRLARVYVSQLDGEESRRETMAALGHASGYLRREIGQRTTLRYVPELSFHFDEGLIASQRINTLLDDLSSSHVEQPPVNAEASDELTG